MKLRQHWTNEQHILVYILKMRSAGEWVKWSKNGDMKAPGSHCTQYSQRHGGSGEGDQWRSPDMGWFNILFGNKKPEIPNNYIRLGEGREEREESMMIDILFFFFGLRNEVKNLGRIKVPEKATGSGIQNRSGRTGLWKEKNYYTH